VTSFVFFNITKHPRTKNLKQVLFGHMIGYDISHGVKTRTALKKTLIMSTKKETGRNENN
jgi:hypothetical protein